MVCGHLLVGLDAIPEKRHDEYRKPFMGAGQTERILERLHAGGQTRRDGFENRKRLRGEPVDFVLSQKLNHYNNFEFKYAY